MNNKLVFISNKNLLENVKDLVQKERVLTLEILKYLREIRRRKIYLEMGYGSLYSFCIHELGYSPGATYRRINAMKLISEIPEIAESVQEGKVSLTNLALLQKVVNEQKKKGVVVLKAEKKAWIDMVANLSTRDAEKILNKLISQKTGEVQRKILKTIQVEITEVLAKKIENLRASSHKFSSAKDEELFAVMVDVLHSKLEKIPAPEIKEYGELLKPLKPSRYISPKLRFWILQKSKNQCQFIDPKYKRRCENRRFLEVDHIKAYSKGGRNTEDNLQVLCREHNAYKGDS